jgi:hypothetical protein
MAKEVKNTVKKSSAIDNEIIVVPLAISVWDIGTPIPGFTGFSQAI